MSRRSLRGCALPHPLTAAPTFLETPPCWALGTERTDDRAIPCRGGEAGARHGPGSAPEVPTLEEWNLGWGWASRASRGAGFSVDLRKLAAESQTGRPASSQP